MALKFLTKPPTSTPFAVAIGNFDGVHLGHQAMLRDFVTHARTHNLPAYALTFSPMPREFFGNVTRIYSDNQKIHYLQKIVDGVLLLDFASIAKVSGVHFAQYLADLGVCMVCVGDDFAFGKDRDGRLEDFVNAGIKVMQFAPFCHQDMRISSSQIRTHLQQGNFQGAQALLGRVYCLQGVVIRGDGIGRTLGFATANIQIHTNPPLAGVYAVAVEGAQGTGGLVWQNRLFGTAIVGRRPTIDGTDAPARLEVHLPKFTGDLYGSTLSVQFLYFLHPQKRYDGLQALKDGIAHDVQALLAWRTHNLAR